MLEYYQLLDARPSFEDSLKALEADIQHANMLAASIPRSKGRASLQMKLVCNQLAPILLYLLRWIDCSCSCLLSSYLNLFHIIVYKVYSNGKPKISSHGRKASIREFYGVILPSLQRLHGDLVDADITQGKGQNLQTVVNRSIEDKRTICDVDIERENECGICLEHCTKVVLPNCCHAMCINCYHDWNTRSESCPFCRGSLKRIKSGDLWVLTCPKDMIDVQTVIREDMLRLSLFINNLPKDIPDALFLMYNEYLF
ncbi:E3 ubiquitin-protein ligase AIRP2-like [Neltuma alba]|uniref:E3 ubiquitin-protein ligase AIRP2-like n=1 Tax=Neltuma alba TaxID=207710 RepID=UPI0010A56606|nr:E3 ubiquitin-protein ligase AIRP2-like [Prosopis alba]XP_028781842.1 E3 ubiquitin-protein ligase AIRP2-like [Prosopis alba]